MAGGLAGSVTVMVLKYLVRDESEGEGASFMTLWLGIANVVANAMVMLRYVSTFNNRMMVVLTGVLARLCFGFRRIWRMIIPITSHSDSRTTSSCTHFTRARIKEQIIYRGHMQQIWSTSRIL